MFAFQLPLAGGLICAVQESHARQQKSNGTPAETFDCYGLQLKANCRVIFSIHARYLHHRCELKHAAVVKRPHEIVHARVELIILAGNKHFQ